MQIQMGMETRFASETGRTVTERSYLEKRSERERGLGQPSKHKLRLLAPSGRASAETRHVGR